MARILLLSGFEPFGGERANPSWEVARRLDGEAFGPLRIKSIRLPVGCARAARRITAHILRIRPAAVLGLGQAAGRPVLSLEQVAINLAPDSRGTIESGARPRPVIAGGPDAYLARLPLRTILREMRRRRIPAAISLSAGAYACNAAMYASLHALRRRPGVSVGFIHLPFEAGQAARHNPAPSMSLDLMEQGVRLAIAVIARALPRALR